MPKAYWVLSMEFASCHPSGTYDFELVPRRFEKLCTPALHTLQLSYNRPKNMKHYIITHFFFLNPTGTYPKH